MNDHVLFVVKQNNCQKSRLQQVIDPPPFQEENIRSTHPYITTPPNTSPVSP